MNNWIKLLSIFLLSAVAVAAQTPQTIPNGLPSWAYNIPDKVQPPATETTGPIHIPGSAKKFSPAEVASSSNPPDWFPEEHGPAPRIVKDETGATKNACGTCHLMSGQGHPESADIAGLPVEYIVRQMEYFKSGARKDDDRMGPIAKVVSDEDVRQAAQYFAAIKPIPWVQVIETATPPKTYVSSAARHRVLSPKDPDRTIHRDPHSPFIAYVPPGSIARGEALVKSSGSGMSTPCATCHGGALEGLGEVPRLAGLQPVYLARQLICIQNGSRNGTDDASMKKVVEKLSEDDIIAISAYLGSLPPQ
jgi:cytochrome c553